MNYPFLIGSLLFFAFASCESQRSMVAPDSNEVMKNKEAIMAFYNKALSVNSETRPTDVLAPLLSENYQSYSSVSSKGPQELIGQLEFFWKLIPDLKWMPEEILNDGDTYVVRSIATGTPNGDFMGLPTNGTKSFKILTIDVHKMLNGQFVSTHHVEDWPSAMKQLAPESKNDGASAIEIAGAFMEAMGKGDMETMINLMHEDMVWQNAGDHSLPWIGPWNGKKAILETFMPSFGANFKTIKWVPDDAISNETTAAFFGQMVGELTKTGQQTEEFTYALRVKVKDGKVILWNWFEDSYEVSKAYHGK